MYTLRHSGEEDIPAIMALISEAQRYFSQKGIEQWQNGYPNPEVIRTDIRKGNSYVVCQEAMQPDSAESIVATAMISFDGEPTYAHIDGAWLTDLPYAVIHRVAVRPELKGQNIAGWIIKEAERICLERDCPCIRIDTHRENLSMQRVATKNGFHYCGVITLADGALRLAYEKVIRS